MSKLPNFFDVHSHVNFPEYDADRALVLSRMQEKDVWTITVGTTLETSRSAIELAEKNAGIFASIGFHPLDHAVDSSEIEFNEKDFTALVAHPKVVAIGECGLDYGRRGTATDSEKARQKKDFELQVDF